MCSILYPLCEVFMPDAVVCQCGADALSQDPLGGANLTLEAYTKCVTHVANLSKPTLFLGGGEYVWECSFIICACSSYHDFFFDPIKQNKGIKFVVPALITHSVTVCTFSGGYDKVSTAKLWTAITGTLLKCPLPTEIPEHQVRGCDGAFISIKGGCYS